MRSVDWSLFCGANIRAFLLLIHSEVVRRAHDRVPISPERLTATPARRRRLSDYFHCLRRFLGMNRPCAWSSVRASAPSVPSPEAVALFPVSGVGVARRWDEIVRDPANNYVAATAGGIHNYQRYPVRVEDGRRIQYIVSGGGGAYVGATHLIPYINLPGVDENDFRCYPRRGDSLCLFSNLYERRFGFGKGRFGIPPEAAATYMAERLGIPPTRRDQIDTHDKTRARRSVELVLPLPGRGKEPLHDFFSEFFDWNNFPLFKHFLRIDASEGELRIRCLAVTGCLKHEKNPPIEDEVRIRLGP